MNTIDEELFNVVRDSNTTSIMIENIIKMGANVDAKDESGKTALMLAILLNRDPELVNALIKAETNLNAQDDEGKTALICAAEFNRNDILNALINAGADLNVRDEYGMTALMWAASKEKSEAVKILINARADISVKNNEGRTAIAYTRNEEIRNIILNAPSSSTQQSRKAGNNIAHKIHIRNAQHSFRR